jgi:2-polyprenyl-3-methyl-5-hydroxy-6-metoxy-1,4-benzoquinol methylase
MDYSTVTETPDTTASGEQLRRLYTRYRFASTLCSGRDILEVACGAGVGLGYLAGYARMVEAGDIDDTNLGFARRAYSGRANIRICKLDAHHLPYSNESFDVVILYEAIYYLRHPEAFLTEARRVLRAGGTLIIGSVNKRWSDFHSSPYSHRYFSAAELAELMTGAGFAATALFGDSRVQGRTIKTTMVSILKRTAAALHLIPGTMKGKQFLKRIVFGELHAIPPEITDGLVDYTPPVPLAADDIDGCYKAFFVTGRVVK